MNQQHKVSFIGLGTMGYPMAGYLSKKDDIEVRVWNRSVAKSQQWQNEFNADVADSLAQAVTDADFVMTCSGRDEDMREILFSEQGIYPHLKPGAVLIDHTTTSHQLATELASKLNDKGVDFLDAPLSGGEAGAINGTLTIMVGGNQKVLERARPLLECYAKKITHIGDSGCGQLAKMVNQICIAGVLEGLSEALLFAESENININALLDAISGGAAQSWQMENRMLTMHDRSFDFGFAIKWMEKDLSYCLDRAKTNKTALTSTQKTYDKYCALIKQGKENLDTSSLVLFNENSN